MNPFLKTIWGTGFRKMITTCTAVCALIVALPSAYVTLGLPEIATKPYVLQVVEPIKSAQSATTQAVNQLLLTQLESALYSAQQDQLKAPSQTVEQRIRELQEQIQQLKLSLIHI